MISNHDRSGYIGASDTAYVVGNWKTKTWLSWWMQKLGINRDHFDNRYTLAGTNFEHRILKSLGIQGLRLDEQIIHENLKLRVNFDGLTNDCTYECKTFKIENGWKVPKKYWQQVQVEMYAAGIKKGQIVAYGLEDADYDNFLRPIDHGRLKREDIAYDSEWIDMVYLPKLRVLADALEKGMLPMEARNG